MTLDLARWLGLLPVSPPRDGMHNPHILPDRMQAALSSLAWMLFLAWKGISQRESVTE